MINAMHPVESLKYLSAFKWYIIYENIFMFDKVMCQFFSYFQIRTNTQTCLYIFKCHTKLNHFQTSQHLYSKTRQNLQKNKVCCGHKVLGRLMQEKLGYICRPTSVDYNCNLKWFSFKLN